MFRGRRADSYLGAVLAWAVCLVSLFLRGLGSGYVTDAVGAALLVACVLSAAAISAIALIITLDTHRVVTKDTTLAAPPSGAARFAVLVTVRTWALLLGFGVRAAYRSLRSGS